MKKYAVNSFLAKKQFYGDFRFTFKYFCTQNSSKNTAQSEYPKGQIILVNSP